MDEKKIALLLSKLQGIAQTGLTYGKDVFDSERYTQILQVTTELTQSLTDLPAEKIRYYMETDEGYATPKVDIRAVVFSEDRLLLVKEKSDGTWALPGGWADIGYSPFEIAEKEVLEEANIRCCAQRLLAVKDKSKHDYPASLTYVYKFFILCQPQEHQISKEFETIETSAAGFFSEAEIQELPLSRARNTESDFAMIFADHREIQETFCD